MAAWVGVPMMVVSGGLGEVIGSEGTVNYEPMMAVLIAMTTATIAGVFVLMAFKIDRGARLEAKAEAEAGVRDVKDDFDSYKQRTEAHFEKLENNVEERWNVIEPRIEKAIAETERRAIALEQRVDEARRTVDDLKESAGQAAQDAVEAAVAEAKNRADALAEQVGAMRKDTDGLDEEVRQKVRTAVAAATSEEAIHEEVEGQIREQIENQVTDAVLGRHIEAVMMLDANGQIVAEFVKERAHDLDEKAVARLIGLLQKIIDSWPPPAREARKGWWAAVKAFSRASDNSPATIRPPSDTRPSSVPRMLGCS